MKNNKKFLIAGGILILIGGILLGTSYGFWKIDKIQKLSNNLTVDCLNLELSDVTDAINLEKARPISDVQAKSLKPYEFKITNTCSSTISYSVNLEVMEIENQLKSEYVAVSFNNEPKEILNTKQTVTPTYKGDDYTANEAYFLTNGEIKGGEEINYTIKLWIDENVTSIDSMNKDFISKISISGELSTGTNLVEYLTNLESSELVEDDFGNLRYIGADPNNYVQFNNELWRIIGVMKDIENADGTKEDKVKLIRSESIGKYSWDNKANGIGSSTSEYGSNDWSDSALQKVLNEGTYYNRTSGYCPSDKNGATTICDFRSTGLTAESKNMISESVWYLDGIDNASKKASEYYTLERENTVYSGRPTTWTGKVGLMYPSDYGYATAGGSTTDRNTCLSTKLNMWSLGVGSDCPTNNWLFKRSSQLTLTPSSSNVYFIYISSSGANVGVGYSYDRYEVQPSIYLNPNIVIENNSDGSSALPFVLKQV